MVSHIYKFTSKCHSQTNPSLACRYPGQGNVFSTLCWQPINMTQIGEKNHPSWSTLRSKGLSCSRIKWWYRYTNLPTNIILRVPNPWSRNNQGKETFLAPSAGKKIRNYDLDCSNHKPCLLTLRSKELSCNKMKWWAIYTNLPVILIFRLTHAQSGDN